MQALYRNVLYSGIIFLTSFSSVFAADLQGELRRASGPKFSVEYSFEFHPKLDGFLSISLKNATQNSLNNYRIVAMVKKDIQGFFVPGNITEHVWRFVAEDDEVVLPLRNLGFTLVIYRGDFDGDILGFEAIDKKMVFMLDGDEIDQSVQSLRLIVR
jgi:hypothetical protein